MEGHDRDSDHAADPNYDDDAELSNNGDIDLDLNPSRPDYHRAHPTFVERFLTGLFADRILSDNSAAAAAMTPVQSHSRSHNNVVPFFSATAALAGDPHSPSPSAPPIFCVEDTVGLLNDRFSIGVIDRTFGDIDTHQPRPQRDYGEPIVRHADVPLSEFARFLRSGVPSSGLVLVSWQTSLHTELIPEARLQLLDRALYVGDVVKRGVDEHMSGTVVANRSFSTLFPSTVFHAVPVSPAAADGLVLHNVPADELLNVHELVEDAIVVYGDWVGRIENVYDEVAVKLSNNSVVIVEDPGELEHDDPTVERLSVGDTVRTKKGNLRRGRWRFGAFDPNVRPEGIIVETRPQEIDVQWLARSIGAVDEQFATMEPPATLGRDEFESPSFRHYDATGSSASTLPTSPNGTDRLYFVADIAVGDRVTFKDIAGAAVKYDGTHTLPNGHPQGKVSRIPRTESLGYDMNVWLVMQTHTQVTVQWQDLTITDDLSISLIPDPNVEDDDEVWPGEIVCSKEERGDAAKNEGGSKKPARVGIVQTVRSRDRIATVRWFKDPSIEIFGSDLLRPASTGELDEAVEDVSLYDIYTTPALTRRRGDFVLIHPNSIESPQKPLSVTGPDWFGEIVDLGLDGHLTVRLGAAQPVVDVKIPYEGATLAYSSDMDDPYMDSDLEDEMDDEEEEEEVSDFDSASFNEMWIEYEGMDGEQTVGNEEDWSTEDEDADDDESMPDLVDDFVEDVDTSKTTPEFKTPAQDEAHEDRSSPASKTQSEPIITEPSIPSNASHITDADPIISSSPSPPEPFAILDQPPPSTHHFLSHPLSPSPTLLRRITKEHRILSTSLPPGIYVRTFAPRLDLLRILLLGPTGTPYSHAPFIIDLHLPPTYPQTPPKAFFHSWTGGQGAVNPNLYEDGTICLSLLGTWHSDERTESWSPARSTLLQLLVSVVGLVLVKEPYYNEAGYEVRRGAGVGGVGSRVYAERAYFGARGFVVHALREVGTGRHGGEGVEPFREVLEYLYYSTAAGAPRLLDCVIQEARDVVVRSERDAARKGTAGEEDNNAESNGEVEGENEPLRISLGAAVMLRRQIQRLEALRQPGMEG